MKIVIPSATCEYKKFGEINLRHFFSTLKNLEKLIVSGKHVPFDDTSLETIGINCTGLKYITILL